MSGIGIDYHDAKPTRNPAFLAPGFRTAVEAAITECRQKGLDAMVYETYRSNELQALYYTRGRTVRPPEKTVTNAMTNLYSWHGYGLAVDVISRQNQWNRPESWFKSVAEVFIRHGCKWGGDWTSKDLPHFQWGLCRASPSDNAREIMRTKGVFAVWQAVGASGLVAPLPVALPAPLPLTSWKKMIAVETTTSASSAHATLGGILKDESVTTLVVLRANAATDLVADVDTRIDGIRHREAVWFKSDALLPGAERASWFPDGSSHVGVVLSSVSNSRRRDGSIPANASIRQIENTLLEVESKL